VARKSKIERETQADNKGAEPAVGGAATQPAKPRRKKAASKKKTVPAVKPVASGKTVRPSSVHEPSDEEIRLRAYFIAERRIQLSLQGDSAHDWIEAKRQLVEEANCTAS